MAAITHVYSLARVAEILALDEDTIRELAIEMFAEDGYIRVVDIAEDAPPVFSEYGIDTLRDIIRELKHVGRWPPSLPDK